MADTSPEEPQESHVEITLRDDLIGGVYANAAVVNHSPFEFTVDFVSIDFTRGGNKGVVVSRIKMSPAFLRDLIDTLERNWQVYAAKAAPTEES